MIGFFAGGANGGATPAWTPADLGASLAFWANEASALTQSGGTASRWDDVRGNGRYFSQATGADQPTVNASGLNGLRTLEFQTSDYMDADSGLFPSTNAKGYIGFIVVYQNRSSSAATRNVIGAAINCISAIRCGLQASRSGNTDKPTLVGRRLDGDSGVTLSAATSTSTNWCMAGVRADYANNDGFVDVNGTLGDAVNTSLFSGAGNCSATDTARIRLGGNITNPASNFADANVAEVLMLTGASMPADSDFDKIFGYLAHKWGLAANLPALHPYKSAPP